MRTPTEVKREYDLLIGEYYFVFEEWNKANTRILTLEQKVRDLEKENEELREIVETGLGTEDVK